MLFRDVLNLVRGVGHTHTDQPSRMDCPQGESITLGEVVPLSHGKFLWMDSAVSHQQAMLLAAEGMSTLDLEEESV